MFTTVMIITPNRVSCLLKGDGGGHAEEEEESLPSNK